ncbi:DUF6328 family protein [Nocardioides sp. 31GB23]|uniref:Threonine/homoserine/homoserine lactone efflux protein n=1 Tax=Nocardioides salarius TaxID=374513 RepID=A0ABS2MDG3_9ACTN|nr:DUF6328 family protein [Nocardioides salarius]MBM7509230.1 threonine/homoserine/homoserine lactone efflux protein [Nocardioides salarius]
MASRDAQGSGREETVDEQADRKWNDLLQELRVMQTGTQLIAGFLLTLPFQSKFDELDTYQRTLYLVIVLVALLTTALVVTPIAVHRRISGRHVKQRLVRVAELFVAGVLTGIGLLLVGISMFVFDVVLGRAAGIVVGVPLLVVVLLLLVGVPERMLRHSS